MDYVKQVVDKIVDKCIDVALHMSHNVSIKVRLERMIKMYYKDAQYTTTLLRRNGYNVHRVRDMVIVVLDDGSVDCANTADGYSKLQQLCSDKKV